MAYTRKLPSGKYQGIATHPTGRKSTRAFPLKRMALTWAEEQESTWRRDRNHDPRAGDLKLAQWVDLWLAARVVERVTADKDTSQLRCHILPRWGPAPLNSITRLDVGAWIKQMARDGTGAHTIGACVRLFATIMAAAVEAGRITVNPAARQRVPQPPAKAPRFFTAEHAEALLAALPEPWRLACDLDLHTGLRIGELLGLKVEAVDWARAEIHVTGVLTRHGWRAYPKSKRSHRTVPIPGHVLDGLAPALFGRDPAEFVFPAPGGGALGDVNFRNRIWYPALTRAGVTRETPHTMRHTAASRLVMAGVDLYRVQALLGHESFATTQRYAHLAPSAHDAIRDAWKNSGARPVHEMDEGPAPGGGQGL